MGKRGWASCSRRTNCNPSRPGSFISVITSSNEVLRARASPVSPRFSTTTLWPSSVRTRRKVMTMAGSSSISRMLPPSLMPKSYSRQDNAENAAVIDLSLVEQRAAVLFDDSRGDRKAKARAGFLGRKEWIEEPLLDLGRDSFAGIRDLENDHSIGMVAQAPGVLASAQGNHAVGPNAVGGILDEIDQHLLDLGGIDANGGADGAIQLNTDAGFFEIRSERSEE